MSVKKTALYNKVFKSGSKAFPLLIVLILVLILFTSIRPQYLFNIDNLRGMLNAMSLTGTIAVGVACLLIGGGMDLSVGAAGCFSGVVIAILIQAGLPWLPALIAAVIVGAAIGAFNAFLIEVMNFMGFIATIGVSIMLQGLANVIVGGKNIGISNSSFFKLGTTTFFNLLSLPFLIMLALMIIYGLILSRTRFGRRMYMCGGNRMAAQMLGLKPRKVRTVLYINSSALSALGGSILAARMRSGAPNAVLGQEFDAITASVLGGIAFMGGGGTMGGCFVGLALLTAFKNGLTFLGVKSYWTVVANGAILIAALIVDYFNTRSLNKRLHAEA